MKRLDKKPSVAAPTWRSNNGLSGNQVLNYDKFFISYIRPGAMAFMSLFNSDGGGEETALCIKKNGDVKYLILNGDYRKQYEKLAPKGLKACKAFYEKNKHKASSWSGR